MKCTEVYEQFYHKSPEAVAFCPYRISPLGAHIDHQFGKINGLAIDKGIEAKVTAEYLKAYPTLEGKYSFHLCESADGVAL